MNVKAQIEAILFVASKPLKRDALGKATGASSDAVEEALETLRMQYAADKSGIVLLETGEQVQFASNPACQQQVDGFTRSDVFGELTRAQLETLTVIAYRGPVTRPEIEQIRGVNCSVILRNLEMRGLAVKDASKGPMEPTYTLSTTALAELGIADPQELPDYETLHSHEHLEAALEQKDADLAQNT